MDKQEKIRIILNKVSELEHESFCIGLFYNDIDKSEYEKHYRNKKGLIISLCDLLEDIL